MASSGDDEGSAIPAAWQQMLDSFTAIQFDQCHGEATTGFRNERMGILLDGYHVRRGTQDAPFSSTFVLHQAAERCFRLMRDALRELRGFSSAELGIVLRANPSPIWDGQECSLAALVANAHGFASADQAVPGSPLRCLLDKLAALTPMQNAALWDACERAWRGNGMAIAEF